ncbi:hypothetical protein Tsp_15312 [Trichinella spiralis]|uniref:hypothetical protein n=1 Tax=Trichinella spiralis TaxID=6334 RepID=UPI0001EFE653|nr:hypothetical protein Tsp_15312 [Trichinella spiralis]
MTAVFARSCLRNVLSRCLSYIVLIYLIFSHTGESPSFFLSTCFPLDCEQLLLVYAKFDLSLVSFTPFYAKFPLFHVKCRKNLKMSLTGYGSDSSLDFLNDFLEESEYRQCQ